jgi:secreted trypsin-like serine protease
VDFQIDSFIIHPNYDEETVSNDLAIMRLVPINGTESRLASLKTISIDQRNVPDAEAVKDPNGNSLKGEAEEFIMENINNAKVVNIPGQLFVTGWGAIKEGSSQATQIPYRAEMRLSKMEACNKDLDLKMNPDSVFCAIGRNYRSDSCQGDSGGAFYLQDGDKQSLVGLVSFGIGCGRRKRKYLFFKRAVPAVYTDLYYFQGFVQDSIVKLRASANVAAVSPAQAVGALNPRPPMPQIKTLTGLNSTNVTIADTNNQTVILNDHQPTPSEKRNATTRKLSAGDEKHSIRLKHKPMHRKLATHHQQTTSHPHKSYPHPHPARDNHKHHLGNQ